MAELHLHIDSRSSRWVFVAALIFAGAPELGSENVTLSTYYPAPSGVYTKMITTKDTWLGRDAGGRVAIGGGGAPLGSAKLSVMDGSVGIGTINPQAMLDVRGDVKVQGRLSASGVQLGDGGACNPAAAGTLGFRGGSVRFCDGSAWQAVGGGGGPVIVSGNKPSCPSGKTAVSYYWQSATNNCCSTIAGWAGTAPICAQSSSCCVNGYNSGGKRGGYVCTQYGVCSCSNTATSWTQVQCQ